MISAMATLIAISVAGCGFLTRVGPLSADGGAIGSVVPCEAVDMRERCDAWIVVAQRQAEASAADVSKATVHVGGSTVPRSTNVRIVVELALRDGSTVFEPIYCGVGADPMKVCDFAGVSLPPN